MVHVLRVEQESEEDFGGAHQRARVHIGPQEQDEPVEAEQALEFFLEEERFVARILTHDLVNYGQEAISHLDLVDERLIDRRRRRRVTHRYVNGLLVTFGTDQRGHELTELEQIVGHVDLDDQYANRAYDVLER